MEKHDRARGESAQKSHTAVVWVEDHGACIALTHIQVM